jgi:hypothetical protein
MQGEVGTEEKSRSCHAFPAVDADLVDDVANYLAFKYWKENVS